MCFRSKFVREFQSRNAQACSLQHVHRVAVATMLRRVCAEAVDGRISMSNCRSSWNKYISSLLQFSKQTCGDGVKNSHRSRCPNITSATWRQSKPVTGTRIVLEIGSHPPIVPVQSHNSFLNQRSRKSHCVILYSVIILSCHTMCADFACSFSDVHGLKAVETRETSVHWNGKKQEPIRDKSCVRTSVVCLVLQDHNHLSGWSSL